MWQSLWDYVKVLIIAADTINEQHCISTGGSDLRFLQPNVFPRWTDSRTWHTCSYLFLVFLTLLLSCCLSDANEQQLSLEADSGSNLYPAGLPPTISGGLKNAAFHEAAFQLLGLSVTSNCMLIFVLISHTSLMPAKKREPSIWVALKPINKRKVMSKQMPKCLFH